MADRFRRKLRRSTDHSDERTNSSFKNIWLSIIEKSKNYASQNEEKNFRKGHEFLKPIISLYQNHHQFEKEQIIESHVQNQAESKYVNSAESESIESTTSSFISFTHGYSPVASLPPSHYSINDYHSQKNNEFYSIFVSVITAAVFLFFIMWRWFKMNSDFRKALQEQLEVQQHSSLPPPANTRSLGQTVNPSTTNSSTNSSRYIHTNRSSRMALLPVNRYTNSHSFIIPNNRDELQATASYLIAQLSNGEYRTARQHQQMIDRARYCLQQLKLHARLTQYQRQQQQQRRTNNYSTFNSNPTRSHIHSSSADYSPSTSSSLSPLSLTEHSSTDSICNVANARLTQPPVPPASITSLQTITSFQNGESIHSSRPARINSSHNFNANNTVNASNLNTQPRCLLNEPPPDYESLMIKSCSLPSYANFNDNSKNEKANPKSSE